MAEHDAHSGDVPIDSLRRVLRIIGRIRRCNGWQESLNDPQTHDVTLWLGPDLHAIEDGVRDALIALEASVRSR